MTGAGSMPPAGGPIRRFSSCCPILAAIGSGRARPPIHSFGDCHEATDSAGPSRGSRGRDRRDHGYFDRRRQSYYDWQQNRRGWSGNIRRFRSRGLRRACGYARTSSRSRPNAQGRYGSGCRAAARGGFTSIACMANTVPAIDTPAQIRYVAKQAKKRG